MLEVKNVTKYYGDFKAVDNLSFTVKEGETPKATIKGRDMYSAAVGSGVIPMKEIVEQILAKGYHDYFAIEHFGSINQLKDMELSAKWFQEVF